MFVKWIAFQVKQNHLYVFRMNYLRLQNKNMHAFKLFFHVIMIYISFAYVWKMNNLYAWYEYNAFNNEEENETGNMYFGLKRT